MNAKIIQIVAIPETEETHAVVVALTEDGRVFKKMVPDEDVWERPWVEVPTDNFVHRLGGLIGEGKL